MNFGATFSKSTRTAVLSLIIDKTRRRAVTPGDLASHHFCQASLLRQAFQASVPRSAVVANCSAAASAANPFLAIVMHFSTIGRISLAFSIVVMMRPGTLGLLASSSPYSRSVKKIADARLLKSAFRCEGLRPKTRPFLKCLMIGSQLARWLRLVLSARRLTRRFLLSELHVPLSGSLVPEGQAVVAELSHRRGNSHS